MAFNKTVGQSTGQKGSNLFVQLARSQQFSQGRPVVVPGLTIRSNTVKVPLDYQDHTGRKIEVFFRVVSSQTCSSPERLPHLLYLQGMEAPRPYDTGGWLGKAVQYFTVVLLDQRGTGNSSPVTAKTLEKLGDVAAQADYLQHFRQDNIVRDAEVIKNLLVAENTRWSILGQSFGGFCCLRYLSSASESLSEVFMTGGIPPDIEDENAAETAYISLFQRVAEQNHKFYRRFPDDRQLVYDIVLHLDDQPEGGVRLPSGGLLTPRVFQLLGLSALGTAGGFERLHFFLEKAFDDDKELSHNFLLQFEEWMPWATNPLYAVMHETIYSQGVATFWAAERVRTCHYEDLFDAVPTAAKGKSPVLFTGEMVFPWMFDEIAALRPFKGVATALAEKTDWPQLYDTQALQQSQVPVAAACYYDDMYVDFALAEKTAQHLPRMRKWVTNEYMHSGIREDGVRILDRLLAMTRDTSPLF